MDPRRLLGIVFTGVGVLIAVLMGVWLAIQPNTVLANASNWLVPASVVFVCVFILMVLGLYFVLTSGRPAPKDPEMEIPLAMVDFLRGRGIMTFASLAQGLNLSENAIQVAVHELITLDIFNGLINEEQGIIGAIDTPILMAIQQCAVCQKPLQLREVATTCNQCKTQYFVAKP